MSRPPKQMDERRSVRMEIRLNISEEKSLQALAENAGLSLSDFIRKTSLGCKPRVQKANPDRAVFIRILGELGKVGSNINQIAKALNTDLAKGTNPSINHELVEYTLHATQTLSLHLIKILTDGDTG